MNLESRSLSLAVLALAAVAVCTGCGSGGSEEAPPATAQSPAAEQPQLPPSRTLPIPGQQAPQPSGQTTHAGDLPVHWSIPQGWVDEPPSSSMRQAQFRVPGAAGDGQCVVYYFGPGQGGDAMANATRWAGQFEQPDGRPSAEVMQVSGLGGTQLPVQIVEVSGTYDGGMTMTAAPAAKQPGYKLLGGIAEGPDAPWFFKFTGPEATVNDQREAFLAMMGSLHVAH